jgi:hypothetical protein
MSIIKTWEPIDNSQNWVEIVTDSEGPQESLPPGRLFVLERPLTSDELMPITDMEQAIACDISYTRMHISVDAPLVGIVHAYLDTLK